MFHCNRSAQPQHGRAKLALAVSVAAATLTAATAACAQPAGAYPTRPVRFIVPFAPGGGTDVVARAIAAKLSESWQQQVIVDNRPGASTVIGVDMVARAAPDGHTIVLATPSFGINAARGKKLPYDTFNDLAFITVTAIQPYVVTVHPSLPVHSVRDLVALAKAKPGALNFGSPGPGSGTHLSIELFQLMTGTSMTHIPYKGSAPALIDLIGGQIDFIFATILSVAPHLKSGRLKGVATTGARRSKFLPDLPTVTDSGVKGYETTSWSGVMAPAATPVAIRDRIHRDVVKVLALPEVRQRLESEGAEPVGSTPAEFDRLVRHEIAMWRDVIERAKLSLD